MQQERTTNQSRNKATRGEDPDGKERTLTLSNRVKNLDQLKPGDTLNMPVTEETAVEVIKS